MDLSNIRIVLVNTSHPGNIGAAARAMKNMGLSKLFLVAPRDFPSGVAIGRAASALDILDNAVVSETLEQAIADCSLVIGTSARSRRIPWPMVNPDECGQKLTREAQHSQVALVFGREDRGLSNEELQLCHYHVQIPANDDYSSLNLAAAVMVLCYEIRKAFLADNAGSLVEKSEEEDWDREFATVEELESFLKHLETLMIRLDFHDPDNPRHLMPRLRRLYSRIRPDKMEINILHGILTATEEGLDKK
ncbi:tRNA (cytosine(32)/uridine(32)-2'-O)-methyltransferase TrmJ [Gammaproteobacteria bacterium]|nr:tRNA (cytosine(32)/uridine(32)-2'-O)-methyltransferase TrmJ [Gammaproteobacteria bacterium]